METEITGHTRKIYRTWKSPHLSVWKKVKEVLVEIVIIVFAVSLAAFLERQREHAHEQAEVKEFLSGLRTDLEKDSLEIVSDVGGFTRYSRNYSMIRQVAKGHIFSADSLVYLRNNTFNAVGFVPNNARYEGFRSSGRINTIEDIRLRNNILDLYQMLVPSLVSEISGYQRDQAAFRQFFTNHLVLQPDDSDNFAALLPNPTVQVMAHSLRNTNWIKTKYGRVATKEQEIIHEIDSLYER